MSSILFINRVYPPDSGATGRVLEHSARGFANAGWDVTILATATFREEVGEEVRGRIRIVRVGILFSKKNLIARALGYALMIPALLLKALRLPRHDVVVTKTDPPMLAVIGPIIKGVKGSRLIHWAQDLYPEVAEECGVLTKGGFMAGILRRLSTWGIQRHDLTLAVGYCMADRLIARGIREESIRVVPNAGIEGDIEPVQHGASAFREAHGIGDEFVIMYSGNMGRAHDFATVLGAARRLQERREQKILFLFVGEGPEEQMVRRAVSEQKLENVRFLQTQPSKLLSESLGTGDLHLVTMKEGMEGLVVPSKFYGVMAAARPTIFVGPNDSEVARMIHGHGIGQVIAPGEDASLAEAILRYRAEPDLVKGEGNKARVALRDLDLLPLILKEVMQILPGTKVRD
jgi:glycosyltransferase involved in cell wall biosynthesis